jgi:hypothetical protein
VGDRVQWYELPRRSGTEARAADRLQPSTAGRKMRGVKIFFVTDLHGSEICWKKFLNAGPFYKADVVILGGDVTGKAMVRSSSANGSWEASLQDHLETFETEAEIVEFEKRVMNRGYYPIRVSRRSTSRCRRTRTWSTSASRRSCSRDRALDRDGRGQAREHPGSG